MAFCVFNLFTSTIPCGSIGAASDEREVFLDPKDSCRLYLNLEKKIPNLGALEAFAPSLTSEFQSQLRCAQTGPDTRKKNLKGKLFQLRNVARPSVETIVGKTPIFGLIIGFLKGLFFFYFESSCFPIKTKVISAFVHI